MVSFFSTLAATCVALTAFASTTSVVQAHGRITNPVVTFTGQYPNSPVDQIDGYKALPPPSGQSYSGTPETNTKAFTEAFKRSSYKTLRAFVLAKQSSDVRACGDTTVDRTPRQRLPDTVEFADSPNQGFFFDHQGPCEIWCGNNTRVFQDDNCAKTFGNQPAKMPYDKAQCDASGADVLTFYWLALHLPKWQLYINCAGIATTGPKTPSAGGNATVAPSSPAAGDSDGKTPMPTHTTAPSPATTTTAPATSKPGAPASNCSRRRRPTQN